MSVAEQSPLLTHTSRRCLSVSPRITDSSVRADSRLESEIPQDEKRSFPMGTAMPQDMTGSAEESVLASALGRVIEQNPAHSLVVSDGVSERVFYFAIGGLRVTRSGPRPAATIADVLVERGKLSRADAERISSSSRPDGQSFADAAVASKLVSRE